MSPTRSMNKRGVVGVVTQFPETCATNGEGSKEFVTNGGGGGHDAPKRKPITCATSIPVRV